MAFKVVKNINEYKQFMLDVYDKFDCEESWEDFFGISLKWNEETGEVLETLDTYNGEIKFSPDEYPSVIHYLLENEDDLRQGKLTIQQIDWISLEEINKKLFKY